MHIAALFAHPDDVELWAGGSLLRHLRLGDRVDATCFYSLSDERVNEARRANEVLGANIYFHAVEPFEPVPSTARHGFIRDNAPDVVLTHWLGDSHLEHLRVFEHALKFCHQIKREHGKVPLLLMTSTYFDVGAERSFQPTLIVDITDEFPAKRSAVLCHQSQHPERLVVQMEAQNRMAGARIGCEYAEAFAEYPLFGLTRTAARKNFRSLLV